MLARASATSPRRAPSASARGPGGGGGARHDAPRGDHRALRSSGSAAGRPGPGSMCPRSELDHAVARREQHAAGVVPRLDGVLDRCVRDVRRAPARPGRGRRAGAPAGPGRAAPRARRARGRGRRARRRAGRRSCARPRRAGPSGTVSRIAARCASTSHGGSHGECPWPSRSSERTWRPGAASQSKRPPYEVTPCRQTTACGPARPTRRRSASHGR